MKIRRFFGKDMREALGTVRDELGGDAVIMSTKKMPDGVEIVAAYDKEPAAASPAPASKVQSVGKKTPSLSEIIGDSGPDSLRALLEKQASGTHPTDAQIPSQTPQTTKAEPKTPQPYGPAKRAEKSEIIAPAGMQELKDELRSLRNVLEFQVSGLLKQEKQRAHPLESYLISRLEQMGIQTALAEDVVSFAPTDKDERQTWLFLLKLLANRLTTTGDSILREQGVVALVGPTGTGKTTTVAKLAAKYAQKYGADQVALVTIDSYRIAAYEQLATYGKIIGCVVKKAHNESELSDVLYQLRNKRLVLIDTAGFGQRDSRLIKQLDTLTPQTCATIKNYLVLQANAQYQVMERTISAYRSISLQGCIFTKLDECYSLGEAISAAIAHRLPLSYLTDGQKVPEDLKLADSKYLISAAAKLYKKYCLTHTTANNVSNPALAV